jgi:hypothetical protein
MKYIYTIILFMCSFEIIYGQVGTYTFSSATIAGQSVIETVGGVLLTVTFNGGGNPGLTGYDGYGGISGNSVYDNDPSSSMTLTFNKPVAISSLRLADGDGSITQNFVLTPTPSGTNNITTVPMGGGVAASLGSSFSNITAITITPQLGGTTWYILDNVVLQTVLPVELNTFIAVVNSNKILLKWSTATEVNNAGFQVERKMNTENEWTNIGFVQGDGNSNSPKEYSFTDGRVNACSYTYRLKQVDNNGNYKFSKEVEAKIEIPSEFSLSQNYPNPFNPTTIIKYQIPKSGLVILTVYNILGKELTTLVNETKEQGYYTAAFDASKFASGVYIYQLRTNDFVSNKKMIIVK